MICTPIKEPHGLCRNHFVSLTNKGGCCPKGKRITAKAKRENMEQEKMKRDNLRDNSCNNQFSRDNPRDN